MLKPLCGDQPCRAPQTRGVVGECTAVFTLHSPWQASRKKCIIYLAICCLCCPISKMEKKKKKKGKIYLLFKNLRPADLEHNLNFCLSGLTGMGSRAGVAGSRNVVHSA